jgi:arylsulfatase A-like enzyme
MTHPTRNTFFLLLTLCGFFACESTTRAQRPPNIIYILADDLGYGDLGCYGQKTLRTPNLDRLAAEGMRFTRHYAGSTVCAPSRCVLLTGMHTGHCRVRGNGLGLVLKPDDTTFAKLFQQAGYKTGAFGKWGVGNPPPLDDPGKHGFDEFYGYVNMFHAHNYYPEFLVHNGKKVPLQNRLYPDWKEKLVDWREGGGVAEVAKDYAPKLISDEMFRFINESHEKPFFVYYALNIPHANNEGGSEVRIGRNGMRVPDLGPFAEKDWPIQEKGFARMMDYIDQDVGKLLDLLKKLNIDEDTIVLFSSDNGPHQEGGHRVDFFDSNGPLRGWKRDLYEGGVRVPFLARWPGKTPAGKTSELVSGFQDVFPTLLELAGVKAIPQTDGISLAPTLLGQPEKQKEHPHLYWEFHERGGSAAVLKGNWKAVRNKNDTNQPSPTELYDLAKDPGEQEDVAKDHPERVAEMEAIMKKEHTPE